ncbi:MAG: hypothetical protein LBS16_07065 [Prevotellaceae bacterium]|jgi:uncharacterized protein (TIGR02145 family)|nr:hypothetical protein [Prevotellaceae bacterium]
MKTNQFIFAVLTAAFLSVANYAAAQVTIGGGNSPVAGAILDLNSTAKGGLLLSNVSIVDLGQIPENAPNVFPGISGATTEQKQALAGMIVWNTNDSLAPNGDGLYLWDGNKWNYTGGSDGLAILPPPPTPPPPVPISAPTMCSNPVPDVTFSHYNLGADTNQFNTGEYATLSPAKQQIRYLADCTPDEAVNVWGDLYQWGRIADGHEKRDAPLFGTVGICPNGQLDDNGQIAFGTSRYGHFIEGKDESIDNNDYNWRSLKIDLWGNGKLYTVGQTDNQGGVFYNGNYYQNTVRLMSQNDPCPTGWRVPTQDEWERLFNYDCKPNTTGGNIASIPTAGKTTTTRGTGNELTWVSVSGGKANINWANTKGNTGGHAVYKTADWEEAIGASGYFYNVNWSSTDKRLYDAAAPEPLLFLPAAGRRYFDNGCSVENLSLYGHYWSSTNYDNTKRMILYFNNTGLYPDLFSYYSTYGCSVRCVKE